MPGSGHVFLLGSVDSNPLIAARDNGKRTALKMRQSYHIRATEEGDILTIPAVPGGLPAVLIPAKALGLATFRSFGGGFNGHGDELDALNMIMPVPKPTTVLLLLLGSLAGLKLRHRI